MVCTPTHQQVGDVLIGIGYLGAIEADQFRRCYINSVSSCQCYASEVLQLKLKLKKLTPVI